MYYLKDRIKENIKYAFIIFILFFIIITLNSYSISAEELDIAFVPKSLDNPIFLDTFEAAEQQAEILNVKLHWVAPFLTNTKKQVEIVNQLIKQNIDGIIISANDSQSLKNVINKAVNNNIPVITFDSDSPDSKRLSYVGTDNYEVGVKIGNSLIDILKNKNILKSNKKLMILSGDSGALNLNQRIAGFNNAIEGKIKIDQSETLYCKDKIQLAIEHVENYLEDNFDTDIIFFTGGWPFYVPADAMPNFKKWAKDGGVAVGIDIFYSALLLQKEGLIDFLIGQDFKKMAVTSLTLIVDSLRGSKVSKDFIDTGYTVSNEENIDELLKIYKPWEVR